MAQQTDSDGADTENIESFDDLSPERVRWLMHEDTLGGLTIRSNAPISLANGHVSRALVGEVLSSGEDVTTEIENSPARRVPLPDEIDVYHNSEDRKFHTGDLHTPRSLPLRDRKCRHHLAARVLEIALRIAHEDADAYDPEGAELWYNGPNGYLLRSPRGDFVIAPLLTAPEDE